MRAITLIRPWPWAIFHAGKDTENRSWAPSTRQLKPGDLLAIHAAKQWDKDGAAWMESWIPKRIPQRLDNDPTSGCIVGVVRFMGCTTDPNTSGWFLGPIGWRLDRPRLLPEPIPCRGALSLWHLPTSVEIDVLRQLELP